MLYVASICTSCCMLQRVVGSLIVAQSLKPVKLLGQQFSIVLLFPGRRRVAQQSWIRLHSSSNIAGTTHAHYTWSPKSYWLVVGVLASVCTLRPTRTQQLPTLSARPFTRSSILKGYLNNQLNFFSGAFDALLKWPFDYRVTFYLLDQDDDHTHRKHIKFTIKPNPCPENEPFLGRPKLEKNASFGGAKFAKHEEIETRNYLKDDTIFLKIAIECDGLSEPWKTKQV